MRPVPGGEVEGRVAHLPGVAVVRGYQRVSGLECDVTGAGVVEVDERASGRCLGRSLVLMVVRDFVPELDRLSRQGRKAVSRSTEREA